MLNNIGIGDWGLGIGPEAQSPASSFRVIKPLSFYIEKLPKIIIVSKYMSLL
jgi:hypothetical protein